MRVDMNGGVSMSSFSDDDDEEDERENTATELPRCSSLVCKDDDDDEEDVDDIELTSESLLVWSSEKINNRQMSLLNRFKIIELNV